MITNDTFEFVVHKENFLSESQCVKLMRYLERNEPTISELAGNYDNNIMNKEVRDNQEVKINDEKLNNKLKMLFELANHSIFKYNIQELESVKILKYGVGGKYKWHTDSGAKETSTRKLTAIVQLSDETNYEGGDLEFGITDKTGKNNYTAKRTRGSITIFPAFLSHRVTPITQGTRYSLITWMNGDCFV
jgi:PKHD-type hydroxylase